jgi:hypothetical protein
VATLGRSANTETCRRNGRGSTKMEDRMEYEAPALEDFGTIDKVTRGLPVVDLFDEPEGLGLPISLPV